MDLLNLPNCDILIELIGEEGGISFDLVKKALENKIHVITANKALLSKNGNQLFEIAENNNTLLQFEAAVAGGITSYMEMPNTIPQTLTKELLEEEMIYQKKLLLKLISAKI